MTFEEAQRTVAQLIRARVYEVQWGGSVMDYVRYFETQEQMDQFAKETGFEVELA